MLLPYAVPAPFGNVRNTTDPLRPCAEGEAARGSYAIGTMNGGSMQRTRRQRDFRTAGRLRRLLTVALGLALLLAVTPVHVDASPPAPSAPCAARTAGPAAGHEHGCNPMAKHAGCLGHAGHATCLAFLPSASLVVAGRPSAAPRAGASLDAHRDLISAPAAPPPKPA